MAESGQVRELLRLVNIMKILRSPQGCPWDREQTPETLKPFLLEETYELLEALDNGSAEEICEELGDLLLQIVFHAQVHSELGLFDLSDVARGISDKLLRRHPQVFEKQRPVQTTEEQLATWQAVKQAEKQGKGSAAPAETDSLPSALPALQRAQSLHARSAMTRPTSPTLKEALLQLEDCMGRLARCVRADDQSDAELTPLMGELLFYVSALAHCCRVDSESALRRYCASRLSDDLPA